MENRLNELLKAVENIDFVNKVYTKSVHANAAKDIMNHLVDVNPAWKNTLLFLSEYPIHKWAEKQRAIIGLDNETLAELLLNQSETPEYFGIASEKIARYQKEVLTITETLSSTIEKTLSNDNFALSRGYQSYLALHGDGTDVSNYIFKQYYEIYLARVCMSISDTVNEHFEKLEVNKRSIDPEIRLIYHDARLLLSIKDDIQRGAQKEEILKNMSRKKVYRQINGYDVYDTICCCINSLSEYPFSGKEIREVMRRLYSGYSEDEVASSIGRSRTYIRAKEEEGVHAIDCLIWGLSESSGW